MSYNIPRYNFLAWFHFLHRDYWFIILISNFERRLFVSWPILSLNAAILDLRSNVRDNKLVVFCVKRNLIVGLFPFTFFLSLLIFFFHSSPQHEKFNLEKCTWRWHILRRNKWSKRPVLWVFRYLLVYKCKSAKFPTFFTIFWTFQI